MSSSRPGTSLEIVAVFKGTVLDVRHLHPIRSGAASGPLALLGGVLLISGLGWFLSQTLGQQVAWAEYQRAAAEAAMAGAELPSAPVSRWLGRALAAALAGLIALVAALVKASDANASSYTIGEGPDAAFATPPADLVTPEAFELARLGAGGAAGLRFTAGMTGTITVRGCRYTLREWAARGWAVAEHGVFGTTLPPGARCRLQHGELVFHIAVVEAAVVSAGRVELDMPFLAISAASFVGLGSLLGLALLSAPEGGRLDLEDPDGASRFVGYMRQPTEARAPTRLADDPVPQPATEVPRLVPTDPAPDSDTTSVFTSPVEPSAGAMPRRSGVAPREAPEPSMVGRSSVADAGGMMARGVGPGDLAGRAGMLAFVDTSPLKNEYSDAFSIGGDNDAADRAMWQAMKDSDPVAKPVGGLGLIGKGRGGGPASTDELVRSSAGEKVHNVGPRSLLVRVGRATVRGPRARREVRNFVVQHVGALRRCYDSESGRAGSPRGRVTLELEVSSTGEVTRASVSRTGSVRAGLTNCMARTARGWSFPATKGKRRSLLSLPLTLSSG